jgi:steroid 5-alpha reductase family enzyme
VSESTHAGSEGTHKPRRAAAFAWIVVGYLAATAAALLVARAMPGARPWVTVAVADTVATVVVFAFSRAFDNSSFYDPYWSLAPMVIAPALALRAAAPGVPLARQVLVTALVLAWGARLTYNWARGWGGFAHEDWRYVDLRKTTGRAYWPVSLFGLHLMPTVSVFLGCLSLFPALCTGTRPLGPLDALAALVTGGAVALEAAADEQLRAFRRTNTVPGRILDTGLWSLCRHPNYLGEVSFWWGLFLFALAADPGAWWAVVGPLWINALFVFVSIPMIDKRSRARRPAYAAHIARVPALFPRLFPRRGR